jgi:hypothetical protein
VGCAIWRRGQSVYKKCLLALAGDMMPDVETPRTGFAVQRTIFAVSSRRAGLRKGRQSMKKERKPAIRTLRGCGGRVL